MSERYGHHRKLFIFMWIIQQGNPKAQEWLRSQAQTRPKTQSRYSTITQSRAKSFGCVQTRTQLPLVQPALRLLWTLLQDTKFGERTEAAEEATLRSRIGLKFGDTSILKPLLVLISYRCGWWRSRLGSKIFFFAISVVYFVLARSHRFAGTRSSTAFGPL